MSHALERDVINRGAFARLPLLEYRRAWFLPNLIIIRAVPDASCVSKFSSRLYNINIRFTRLDCALLTVRCWHIPLRDALRELPQSSWASINRYRAVISFYPHLLVLSYKYQELNTDRKFTLASFKKLKTTKFRGLPLYFKNYVNSGKKRPFIWSCLAIFKCT